MKVLVLLICAWSIGAEPFRDRRNIGQTAAAPAPQPQPKPVVQSQPEANTAPAGNNVRPAAHRPVPIAVYGSGKTIFKQSGGKIHVIHQSLARQAHGRFSVRGFGWAKHKNLTLPAWASKSVILLPYGSRRPVVQRPGTVKSGSKIYHVVKITQVQAPEKLEELSQHLIQVLFEKQVISAQVGAKIIHTFGLKPFGDFLNQTKEVLQYKTAKTLNVKGLIKARNRFVLALRLLINRREAPSNKIKSLVKNLYQLVLDNELHRIPVAVETASKYGVRIQVTARSQGLSYVHKPGLARFINVVQTIKGTKAQLTALANHLAPILIKRRIVDVGFVRQLFATFSVTAQGKLTGAAEPFSEEDLKDLFSVRGRPLTRRRLIHDLNLFVSQLPTKTAEEKLEQVVRLLTRLIVGNGIRRVKQFEDVVRRKFGVSIVIQRQFPNFAEQPWLKPKKVKTVPVTSLVYFHRVFHASPVPKDKSSTYIRKLLDLLVEKELLDLHVARTLLATFNIKAPGKFAPSADVQPWTPETIANFKLGGNHFSKGNFLNVILQLLLAKEKPEADKVFEILSRSLLELSLDNEIIDIKNATELAASTGVKVICRKLPAPPPKPEEVEIADEPEEQDEDEEDEEDEGGKILDGGLIQEELQRLHSADKPTTAKPQQQTTTEPPHEEELEEDEEDSAEDDSDSAEDKSGDSSESDETAGTPAPAKPSLDEDDDDDDDNIKTEKVIDSTVSFGRTVSPKRQDFILHIVNVAVEKELLKREAVERIFATFGIDGGNKFPKDQKPLTEDSVDELNVDGTDESKAKFTSTLGSLISSKDQGDHLGALLKLLFEFVIDNKAVSYKEAEPLAKSFGYGVNVDIKKVKVELEHNLNLGQQAAFNSKYLSQVEIEESEENSQSFAENALATLVDNSLIETSAALNLLHTFGYNGTSRFGDIKSAKKLDKAGVYAIQVVSDPDAKKKFYGNLEKQVSSGKARPVRLIGAALELALDNAVIDVHAAGKIAVQYGFSSSIKVIKTTSQPDPGQASPSSSKRFSQVQITGSYAEDLSPFLNQLAGSLAVANVLKAEISNNLFATFGVTKVTGKSILPEEISKLEVKGDPDAKSKFLTGLSTLISKTAAKLDPRKPDQAEPDFDLTVLLKIYLELLLDNGTVQAQDAAQLAVSHGVSISIQETAAGAKTA